MSLSREGKSLKSYREENGLTLQEVGDINDSSRSYISYLQSGKRIMTFNHAYKISEEMNVKPSVLLINHLTFIQSKAHRNFINVLHKAASLIDRPDRDAYTINGRVPLEKRLTGQRTSFGSLLETMIYSNPKKKEWKEFLRNEIVLKSMGSDSESEVLPKDTQLLKFTDFVIQISKKFADYSRRLFGHMDDAITRDTSQLNLVGEYFEHKEKIMRPTRSSYISVMNYIPKKKLDEEGTRFSVDTDIFDSIENLEFR